MHVSDISRRLLLVLSAALLVIGGLGGSAIAGVLSPTVAANSASANSASANSAPAASTPAASAQAVTAAGAAALRPCDIYAIGRTPCVAAYSTVRALYLGYHGPLYP